MSKTTILGVIASAALVLTALAGGMASADTGRTVMSQNTGNGFSATPGGGSKVACNGKTTSQCCEGISYCGCLYAPGSTKDRPTACYSSPPSSPKKG